MFARRNECGKAGEVETRVQIPAARPNFLKSDRPLNPRGATGSELGPSPNPLATVDVVSTGLVLACTLYGETETTSIPRSDARVAQIPASLFIPIGDIGPLESWLPGQEANGDGNPPPSTMESCDRQVARRHSRLSA